VEPNSSRRWTALRQRSSASVTLPNAALPQALPEPRNKDAPSALSSRSLTWTVPLPSGPCRIDMTELTLKRYNHGSKDTPITSSREEYFEETR
jgi:hypothetical protein